ncbi:unnamed protein product [Prorocentrum cordatum]|uniref:Chitin synthase n=1 Tax=Prorocentrum cordatum TaxID=2364126 RepID=A0ABN9R6B5_9DINO|nr:unnamed protein product [Polarella glacialis]
MSNRPWFVQDPFIALNARDFCFDGRNITKQTVTAEYSDMGTSDIATLRVVDEFVRHMYHVFVKDNQSLIGWFLAFIVMALLGAVVAMPFTGSSFVAVIAWSAGPCLLFLVLLVFIQFRVFGPLTFHPFLGVFRWNLRGWQAFVSSCFVIALFVPMYQELRSIWHRYYRYSLQTNFFACGRDRLLHELRESACCPHVILTGTVNDYRTTGAEKEDTVAEISFSSLHLGSGKLGYCRSPRWESLSKLTALTGAGCLDAAALSLNSQSAALKMRFWLEVLNLSWGDYVLFGQHQGHAWRCVEDLGRRAAKRCPGWEGMFVYASHRITPGTALCVTYLLMNLAWHLKSADMAFTCHLARTVSVAAFGLLLFILALSFFASCPALQWTMFSPWLRQIHQGIAHQYEGPSPPGLLYVTDGGVADCTTLVQLMMRGSERILLVLAAADPDDDLGVLRAAMDVARKEKIGGFFDPADARRDVNILFDEFKQSRDKTWMHVGIRYGWDGPEAGRKLGHLVIVKNRLPDQFKSRPCHPPLTEDEIKHGPGKTSRRPSEDAERLDMNSDELGPWGCCDCCHGLCNCGPKFPHGNFAGYLYLTPAWFNELCRLGYDISQEAVDALFTLRFDEGLAAARA